MKTNFVRVLAIVSIALSASLFSLETNEYEIDQLDKKTFNELFSSDREYVIFKFNEGATFPLKLTMKGEIFGFDAKDDLGNIIVKSPFYIHVRYPKDLTEEDFDRENPSKILEFCEFKFSIDKTNWKFFGDFITGSINAAIFTESEESTCAELGLDLNFNS